MIQLNIINVWINKKKMKELEILCLIQEQWFLVKERRSQLSAN